MPLFPLYAFMAWRGTSLLLTFYHVSVLQEVLCPLWRLSWLNEITGIYLLGRAVSQAVRRRVLAAKARIQFQCSPYLILGGQCVIGTTFFPSISVSACQSLFH
jgi:hypothetical protein